MKQTIYIPVKVEEELPEPSQRVFAWHRIFNMEWLVVAYIDGDTGKWIEDLEAQDDVFKPHTWLKPVEMPSEEDIYQLIKITDMTEDNGPLDGYRTMKIAKAITKLMSGK